MYDSCDVCDDNLVRICLITSTRGEIRVRVSNEMERLTSTALHVSPLRRTTHPHALAKHNTDGLVRLRVLVLELGRYRVPKRTDELTNEEGGLVTTSAVVWTTIEMLSRTDIQTVTFLFEFTHNIV